MIRQDIFILIWMENLDIKNKIAVNGEFAARKLNLRINSGEYVCISGLYGTDKVSFINTISCLDRPDGGKYLYDYNDTSTIEKNKLDLLRSEIGFLFKNLNIIEEFTVYENIEIPLSVSSILEKPREISRAAEKLGLIDKLYIKAKELTDFEKHKVALARALAVNPILIIADEPADGLMQNDAEELFDILSDLNGDGVAIICFSENKNTINQVKRHIIFEHGCIKYDNGVKICCKEEGAE